MADFLDQGSQPWEQAWQPAWQGNPTPVAGFSGSGMSRVKYNFLLAKTFANPNTPCALFANTISVSDPLSTSTFLGKPLSTEINNDTSEYQCLGCKKYGEHSNAQMLLLCPTNKHAGEAQYGTFLQIW